jgi:hypothetical protein
VANLQVTNTYEGKPFPFIGVGRIIQYEKTLGTNVRPIF